VHRSRSEYKFHDARSTCGAIDAGRKKYGTKVRKRKRLPGVREPRGVELELLPMAIPLG
jgi:hypothetical protein